MVAAFAGLLWAGGRFGEPGRADIFLLLGMGFLVPPVTAWLGATAKTRWEFLFRGGPVADVFGICLIVHALTGGEIGLFSAMKAYLVMAALVVAICAWTWRFRQWGLKSVVGQAIVPLVVILAQSSLIWGYWPCHLLPTEHQERATTVLLHSNPLLGLLDAVRFDVPFNWLTAEVMYGWTRLGQDVAALTPDWLTVLLVFSLLAVLGFAGRTGLVRASGKNGHEQASAVGKTGGLSDQGL